MNIYLDYNSTTPVDKRVLECMLPFFTDKFGNAASKTHSYGWLAEEAVKNARRQVSDFLNCNESEIVFTSGATEAINLGIKGVAEAYSSKGKHIVTVLSEHKAVLDTCKHLEKQGYEITLLPVFKDGTIDLFTLGSSIRPDTILVCVMLANNETGVIQPINEIAEIAHKKGTLLFTDATQACGKIRTDVNELNADLLCLSAHKIYGPKGVGALYVRRKDPRVSLEPLIHGGGHERGFRSGTLNVPGIVGLGKACEIISLDNRIEELRNHLEQSVSQQFNQNIIINGKNTSRIGNTSNITFPFKAEKLIHHLKNKIAVATGSACTSAENTPSHVLMAMGLSKEKAESSIRFSLGKYTTQEEIEKLLGYLSELR